MNSVSKLRLQEIVRRSTSLYSLPSVAMEVVELTQNPDVTADELRKCIECDPGLVAKVLRVVNSSMFGLREQVSDLTQALNYLGAKSLKCLVLSSSLPDELIEQASADRLAWYWTRTLTRAVAARLLAERSWKKAGDEALVAGLMQDIGVLAMLRELGTSYAQFLQTAVESGQDISEAERRALGFDHLQVSAALLRSWKLPEQYIEAIQLREAKPQKLARHSSPAHELAKILQLADLLAQLVGGHRLQILPDLVEAAALYRNIEKNDIIELVRELQPHVHQFAETLSVSLPEGKNYDELLDEADARMSEELEGGTGTGTSESDDEMCDRLMEQTVDLTDAMSLFMASGTSLGVSKDLPQIAGAHAAHDHFSQGTAAEPEAAPERRGELVPVADVETVLKEHIISAARSCRLMRRELSLLLVQIEPLKELVAKDPDLAQGIVKLLEQTIEDYLPDTTEQIVTDTDALALIIADCDRQQASECADMMIDSAADQVMINIGCMTAVNIPKNFEASRATESAARCLSAAQSSGGSSFKSIEIY